MNIQIIYNLEDGRREGVVRNGSRRILIDPILINETPRSVGGHKEPEIDPIPVGIQNFPKEFALIRIATHT